MASVTQTPFSHKLFEPTPRNVSEGDTHCVMIFEKLRLQREQGRFCDVILKVQGREFPAHRCVLAACSSWFDTKFKVHKILKETIVIEDCKNYEVFHRVLTYIYTGQVSIDKHNVEEILQISHSYTINKLKNYCSEYLEKNLRTYNCLRIIDLAQRFHLNDLWKHTITYIHNNFEHIIRIQEIDKKNKDEFGKYLMDNWNLPGDVFLRIIAWWTLQSTGKRECYFVNWLGFINWSLYDPDHLSHHLETDLLYQSSAICLYNIFECMEKNSIQISPKFQDAYRDLQEKLLSDNELEELHDSNSFLSMAINSDVLDQPVVDETFSSYILQQDNLGDNNQYAPYRHPSGNYIESYKNDVSDSTLSVDFMSFNSGSKKPSSLVMSKGDMIKYTTLPTEPNPHVENHEFAPKTGNNDNDDGHQFEDQNQIGGGSQANMCQQLDNSQYAGHVQGQMENSNISYRNSPPDSCSSVYKPHYDPSQQMNHEFYRTEDNNMYHNKTGHMLQDTDFSVANTKCIDTVSDSSFSQDIFKNSGVMYREDTERASSYMCQTSEYSSRGETLYQEDLDNYRTLCNNQFENYKSNEEGSENKSSYNQYKYDPSQDLKHAGNTDVGQQAHDKLERLQSLADFDCSEYQILEQVINEQSDHRWGAPTGSVEKQSSATKRYDPKFRALAEAFRHSEPKLPASVTTPDLFGKSDTACHTANNAKNISPAKPVPLETHLTSPSSSCKVFDKYPKERSDCQYSEEIRQNKENFTNDTMSRQYLPEIFSMNDCHNISKQKEGTVGPATEENNTQSPFILPDMLSKQPLCNEEMDGAQEQSKKVASPVKPACQSQDAVDENESQLKIASPSCPPLVFSPVKNSSFNSSLMMTPKEKYAKEMIAEKRQDFVQNKSSQSLDFNIEYSNAVEDFDSGQSPIKHPSAIKILKAKKKMAAQKKLILEHGEVKPLTKHRSRLKISRKFLDMKSKEGINGETTKELCTDKGSWEHKVKTIVNRKDKLLAEHRSQQSPSVGGNLEQNSVNTSLDQTNVPSSLDHTSIGGGTLDHIINEKQNEEFQPKSDCSVPSGFDYVGGTNKTKCPFCEQEFNQEDEFDVHIKDEHLTVRPREKKAQNDNLRFTCDICSKVFASKVTLAQHQAVHTSEKKFKCRQCSYSTKYHSHLTAHKRVHDGKVHRCYFERCQYWTPKMTLLKAHIRIHNNVKNYKCTVCGKAFVEAGQLKRHEKIHTGSKPFKCEEGDCTYATYRKDKLKEHKNNVHKATVVSGEPSTSQTRPSKLLPLQKCTKINQLASSADQLSSEDIPFVKVEEIKTEILGL